MKILVPFDKCRNIGDAIAAFNAGHKFIGQDGKEYDRLSIVPTIKEDKEMVVIQLGAIGKCEPGDIALVYCHQSEEKQKMLIDNYGDPNTKPGDAKQFFRDYAAKFNISHVEAIMEGITLTNLKAKAESDHQFEILFAMNEQYNNLAAGLMIASKSGLDVSNIITEH